MLVIVARYMFLCIGPQAEALHEIGLELPGLEAVPFAALRLAIDIRDREGPARWRGWTIRAMDEAGRTVFTGMVSPEYEH